MWLAAVLGTTKTLSIFQSKLGSENQLFLPLSAQPIITLVIETTRYAIG
jgi:hypothetical protein